MKKAIIVRKNKRHRIGIRVLTVTFLAIAVLLAVCSKLDWAYTAVLCFPWILLLVVPLLYYETWQISFSGDNICKRVFFCNTGSYSYYQLADVVMAYSYTEHHYIRMTFVNGRNIRFQLKDEYADKALTEIRAHRSIRTLV